MAEPPKSRYDELRALENQKSEAAPKEPTRPETIRRPSYWAQSQTRPAQESSATLYNKDAQEKKQEQWEAQQLTRTKQPEKQPEKSDIEQAAEKQKAIREVADKLASPTIDRAEHDREH
jgi:hypothetical protein